LARRCILIREREYKPRCALSGTSTRLVAGLKLRAGEALAELREGTVISL
jgi:hypothetical protein